MRGGKNRERRRFKNVKSDQIKLQKNSYEEQKLERERDRKRVSDSKGRESKF